MKYFVVPALILLTGCQMATTPGSTTNTNVQTSTGSTMQISEQGNRNIDLFSQLPNVQVQGENVAYTEGVKGYLAWPNAAGKYPAIVIVHEWWGLNSSIKDMARLLANEGYVVLAVDLYDGKVATTSADAGSYAGAVRNNTAKAVDNMKAAEAYLKALPQVNPQKIAALGWCFGGQQALNFSLASSDLSATVIYYGTLTDNKDQLKNIKWPVLGIFGEADTSVTVDSVRKFQTAINELGIRNEIYVYPNVGHAFANPSGERYAPAETLDAWDKTLNFLNKNLKA